MFITCVLYVAFFYLVVSSVGGFTTLGADGSLAYQEYAGLPSNPGEEFLVGDCLLPPRTRTTGGLVIEIPRRPLKTTRQECARQGGRIVSAQEAWGSLAAQGDNEGKIHLANAQSRGDPGAQNCRQGAELYQQVIARGDPQERANALVSLAYLYETGCGVARDVERARALYAEALGLEGPPPASSEPRVTFGSFYALVIGNNRYRHLPQLSTAVNDAREVAELLRTRYRFEVKLLIDTTRDEILESLEGLRRRLTERDNLLIYYAGHGVLDEQNDRGYWQPVDARRDSRTQWIKTEDVTDIINTMLAYRVLIVSDSCFSGAWTRSVFTDLYPEKVAYWIERLARKRARLVLASGGLEPVPDRGGGDHSVFAKYFLQALKENTDILVGRRLFDYLDIHVPYEAKQGPVYAPMRFVKAHEGGEFFFQPMNGKPPAVRGRDSGK
jgi:Caspase domain